MSVGSHRADWKEEADCGELGVGEACVTWGFWCSRNRNIGSEVDLVRRKEAQHLCGDSATLPSMMQVP